MNKDKVYWKIEKDKLSVVASSKQACEILGVSYNNMAYHARLNQKIKGYTVKQIDKVYRLYKEIGLYETAEEIASEIGYSASSVRGALTYDRRVGQYRVEAIADEGGKCNTIQ